MQLVIWSMIEQRGATVEYAIHPSRAYASHMNVLLAEADVSYEQLRTLEEINPDFDEVDIAIVLGANDVVNPEAARKVLRFLACQSRMWMRPVRWLSSSEV